MTYLDTKTELIINKLTRKLYNKLSSLSLIDDNQLYVITDDKPAELVVSTMLPKMALMLSGGTLSGNLLIGQDSKILNINAQNGFLLVGGNLCADMAGAGDGTVRIGGQYGSDMGSTGNGTLWIGSDTVGVASGGTGTLYVGGLNPEGWYASPGGTIYVRGTYGLLIITDTQPLGYESGSGMPIKTNETLTLRILRDAQSALSGLSSTYKLKTDNNVYEAMPAWSNGTFSTTKSGSSALDLVARLNLDLAEGHYPEWYDDGMGGGGWTPYRLNYGDYLWYFSPTGLKDSLTIQFTYSNMNPSGEGDATVTLTRPSTDTTKTSTLENYIKTHSYILKNDSWSSSGGYKTATALNYTITSFDLTSSSQPCKITLPAKTDNNAVRDFVIRIDSTVSNVTLSCVAATGETVTILSTDSSWNTIDSGTNIFSFTETKRSGSSYYLTVSKQKYT